MTRVLVVAAHPDDELLGCGGTIARHADAGDDVRILILAEGATSRDDRRDPGARADELEALRAAALAAAGVVGAREVRFAGLPDNRMDTVALLDVTKIVEAAVAEWAPVVVYTHHHGDLNVDHRIAHAAVTTAARALPDASVRHILAFETLSSTEWGLAQDGSPFAPRRFHDIEAQLERKLDALRCYASEMRPFPHARSFESVEALARLRGSAAGVGAAEAFEVVRDLW